MNSRILQFLVLFCFAATLMAGQTKVKPKPKAKVKERMLIQFSGVVVDNDSLRPVAATSIFAKNTYHGTISDFFGYFSFVAQAGDTIEFSKLGFKNAIFTIPDTLFANKYSLIQVMRKDTFLLNTVVIYPWPTPSEFVQAFIHNPIPGDDLDRARFNLSAGQMTARTEAMPNDASMNYKTTLQQQYSRLYYAGGAPPNNLLNPIAWYKFVEAWKRGDFKKATRTPASPDPGVEK
jgi:hypothetical protein